MDAATWLLAGAGLLTFAAIAYQAFVTRKLAQSTAQDVEAQWRPLLVPCRLETMTFSGPVETSWAALTDEGAFVFRLTNIGKGPALAQQGYEITGPLTHPGATVSRYYCEPLINPVLDVGGKEVFTRRDAAIGNNRIHVEVTYTDLARRPHRTQVMYQRKSANDAWRVEEVVPDGEIDWGIFHPVGQRRAWRRLGRKEVPHE